MRMIGTVVRGVRAPILKAGDDLAGIALASVLAASKESKAPLRDRDVVGVTESALARTQGNFATLGQIAADVRAKIPAGPDGRRVAGIVLPIQSRNRFSLLLQGIAMGVDKLYIQLAYPADEVGNVLISPDMIEEKGINPYTDVITEARFRELFGEKVLHAFTGIDYVRLYGEMAQNAEIFLANDPREMLKRTENVIACDIHTRARTQRLLTAAGARTALTLADLLSAPVEGSGYNPEYGLYGTNMASEDSVKLLPRDCQAFVEEVAGRFLRATGKRIEVMIYGDGAFKDPVFGIWELADPVVSPGYTKGLVGKPNEIKLKYLADTQLKGVKGEEAAEAAREAIRNKARDLTGDISAQGTTPRRIMDLLGSLCDLTSGSGDKGTPIVWVQGYFDSYADETYLSSQFSVFRTDRKII